jgi:hypothetical protein
MLTWRPQQEVYSSYVEVFKRILLHRNLNVSQLTKGHSWYPWRFQQSVGRLPKTTKNVLNEEPRHFFKFNFRILVHGVGVVSNKEQLAFFLISERNPVRNGHNSSASISIKSLSIDARSWCFKVRHLRHNGESQHFFLLWLSFLKMWGHFFCFNWEMIAVHKLI